MTAGPEYTLEALLDIFVRALTAVEDFANVRGMPPGQFQGWQYEFAMMTKQEQARWLLHCVRALTMGEVAWIDKYLEKQ